MSANAVLHVSERLAVDLLESINNILKRTAEFAIAFKSISIDPAYEWMTETARESATVFGKEAKKSIVKEFGRFGKNVGPAIGRFLKRLKLVFVGGAAITVETPMVGGLLPKFPDTFGWLEPLLKFLYLI